MHPHLVTFRAFRNLGTCAIISSAQACPQQGDPIADTAGGIEATMYARTGEGLDVLATLKKHPHSFQATADVSGEAARTETLNECI